MIALIARFRGRISLCRIYIKQVTKMQAFFSKRGEKRNRQEEKFSNFWPKMKLYGFTLNFA